MNTHNLLKETEYLFSHRKFKLNLAHLFEKIFNELSDMLDEIRYLKICSSHRLRPDSYSNDQVYYVRI